MVGCIDIDAPGMNTQVNDIPGSVAECCINITASDVTFDGNGHYLSAAEVIGFERSTSGVCVGGTGTLSNVTVKIGASGETTSSYGLLPHDETASRRVVQEGPSVRAVANHLKLFEGRTVISASGNARVEKERLRDERIEAIFGRGKQLVIQFPERALTIHFLMFGSYRINEVREGMQPRLTLEFHDGRLTFYNCAVRLVFAAQLDELVKDEFDILSNNWHLNKVLQRSAELKEAYICDALLDQNVFAGIGNIIKNEALFRAAVQPLSVVSKIPEERLETIALEARAFSQRFYEVRNTGEKLNPYLQTYRNKQCPRCGQQVQLKRTGKSARISFFCPDCQVLYA